MSIIKSEDSRKWITSLVILSSLCVGYVSYKFFLQLGAWFDLEVKISSYNIISQGLGFIIGASTFGYILRGKFTSQYLHEVYDELLKVVWPTKDATIKITIGVTIGLLVVAGIFTVVDFIFRKVLDFVY